MPRRPRDDDPPPRHSPRLLGQLGDVATERPADRRRSRPTEGQRERMRRNMALVASRQLFKMSYRMLGETFDISHQHAKRVYDSMTCAMSRD